jgi:hypothetical protein
MNTTNLKKLAPELRFELLDAVGARLKYVLGTDSVELREKAAIIRELERSVKREGEAALIERVAYTWFNRLAALRFIDARGLASIRLPGADSGLRQRDPAGAIENIPLRNFAGRTASVCQSPTLE